MQDCQVIVPNCPHLNQIENFENSFMVCTDCGLEVDQIYCNPPTTSSDEKWFDKKSFFKTYPDRHSNSLTTVFVEIKYQTHAFMKFTIITSK